MILLYYYSSEIDETNNTVSLVMYVVNTHFAPSNGVPCALGHKFHFGAFTKS